MNGKVKTPKLKLDAIRHNAGIQTRAHIDDCTVNEYAEATVRGDCFPPVVVFRHNGDFVLADGWHRVRAARRARLPHILAEVRPGDRKDALRFALGCDQAHGLRRSNADKRRSVEIALREFGTLSDRLVAEMCGVSQPFVSNIRQQLITVISSKPRLGKDGKMRALPIRETNSAAEPSVVAEDTPGDDDAPFMEVCERVMSTRPTLELYREMLGSRPRQPEDISFRYYFLSRTSFSGSGAAGQSAD